MVRKKKAGKWIEKNGKWEKIDLSTKNYSKISPKTFLKEKIYDQIPKQKKKKIKVSSDEFEIPEVSEYNLLLKYNYTCHQLSQICKYYKQKVSGNKSEKIFRLYNYLKYSNYSIKIQKILRGYLIRKLFAVKNMSMITKCVNDTDFLTLEEIKNIELKQLIVIRQYCSTSSKIFYYAYNILSLWNLIENARMEKKKEIYNPFTREKMDYDQLKKVGRKIFRLTKAVYGKKINIDFKDDYDENVTLENRCKKEAVDLFQNIDTIGNFITDSKWLLNLDKVHLIRFVRELRDCWEYRLQLTTEIKRSVCPPYGRPFESINIPSLGHRPQLYVLKKVIKVMKKFINTGIDQKAKNLGIFYVLGALTMQSHEAANALPWMYESFMHQNN